MHTNIKRFFKSLFLFAIISINFSCSFFDTNDTSSVRFSVQASRTVLGDTDGAFIDVELKGDYETQNTFLIASDGTADIRIDNVPVGANVYISVAVYTLHEEEKVFLYRGESETQTILSGENYFTITLERVYESITETSSTYIITNPTFTVEQNNRLLTNNKIEFNQEKDEETFIWKYNKLGEYQKAVISFKGRTLKTSEDNLISFKCTKTSTGAKYYLDEKDVPASLSTYEFLIPQGINIDAIGIENHWDVNNNSWAGDFSCIIEEIRLIKDTSLIDNDFNQISNSGNTYTVRNPALQSILNTQINKNSVTFDSTQGQYINNNGYSSSYWEFDDLNDYDKIYITLHSNGRTAEDTDKGMKIVAKGYTPRNYYGTTQEQNDYHSEVFDNYQYVVLEDGSVSQTISFTIPMLKNNLGSNLKAIEFQNCAYTGEWDGDSDANLNYGEAWSIEVEEIRLEKVASKQDLLLFDPADTDFSTKYSITDGGTTSIIEKDGHKYLKVTPNTYANIAFNSSIDLSDYLYVIAELYCGEENSTLKPSFEMKNTSAENRLQKTSAAINTITASEEISTLLGMIRSTEAVNQIGVFFKDEESATGKDIYLGRIYAVTKQSFTYNPFVEKVLYVSPTGNNSNTGFGSVDTKALKTFDAAISKIQEYGSPDDDWTIRICGNLITNKAEVPADLTSEYAKTLEITGNTPMTGDDLVPSDKINQNRQTGTALSIKTSVPVTITNLGITGGRTTVGAGMFISQNSIVKLGDGVYIIDNNTGSGNGRGGGIHNEGTLFVYGTAAIGNPFATTWAVGDSSSAMFSYLPSDQTSSQYNANYSGLGGGIYNGTGDGTNNVVSRVYLGYSGYEADGITPVEETLTGGIYANGSSSGAGIYNQLNCEVYYKSGTIKYNTASATGGGIYNYGKVEMSGGEIVSNIAYFPWNSTFSGGGIYNGYSNYTRATCIISGGIINKNYATFGGGVYNAGNLYLYGSAVIGDKTATSVASATSNETCGNKAGEGAGIYNIDGTVYIGYDADGNIDTDYTDNGGIYYNLATNIYNSSNYYGGAIYNQGSNNNGLIKMASGTIAYNASDDLGGAVYLSSSKNFELSGGSIRNNEAANNGGAFCITNKESFSISGNPSIPKGSSNKNDILLKGTLSSICFDGPLNSSFEAYLNFSPYRRDSNLVLSMTKNVTSTTVADEYTKFIVAPYSVVTQAGTTLSPKYVLTSDGYLVQGDVGGADAATYISNMTTSGTVIIGGKLTTGTVTAISTALQNLSTFKPDIRVSLDLSNASGFTESLGNGAFKNCTCLQEVKYIPTVTRIDASTFEGCSNLTTITIPVKINEIRASAFTGSSLTTVNYMGTEAQKSSKITKLLDTTIQNATWNYISYVFNITLDTGTNSDISVSVHDGDGNTLSSVSSIEKGTSLIFSTSSYSTYKWKVDGSVQSETSSLEINTSGWVVGATYNVSLIATDASGNEDSYFAQITVTE